MTGNLLRLDDLAGQPRWVAWKLVKKRGSKAPTKVPYGDRGEKAETNNPATWLTNESAERLRSARCYDGIGIVLGDLGDSTCLAGIDLDSCIDDVGGVAAWATRILRMFPDCYAEVSPSGTGIKIFLRIAVDDVRPFLTACGAAPGVWGL
jgi:primase-polymerase (primpol)-like protein